MNGAGIGALFWLIGFVAAAAQPDISAQRAALKEIRETAADICYTVEQRGQKSEAQLTGEVQAKVTGVIAKVTDLGVKGSGQIGSQEYQGVSQDALGAALLASANCRERVFNKLVDRILPPKQDGRATPAPDLGVTRRPNSSNSELAGSQTFQLKSVGRGVRPVASGEMGAKHPGYAARVLLQNVSGGTLFIAAEGRGQISIGNCTALLGRDNVSGLGVGYDLSRVVGNGLLSRREALQVFPVDAQMVITVQVGTCELADRVKTDVSFPIILSRDQQRLLNYNISIIDTPIVQ